MLPKPTVKTGTLALIAALIALVRVAGLVLLFTPSVMRTIARRTPREESADEASTMESNSAVLPPLLIPLIAFVMAVRSVVKVLNQACAIRDGIHGHLIRRAKLRHQLACGSLFVVQIL